MHVWDRNAAVGAGDVADKGMLPACAHLITEEEDEEEEDRTVQVRWDVLRGDGEIESPTLGATDRFALQLLPTKAG